MFKKCSKVTKMEQKISRKGIKINQKNTENIGKLKEKFENKEFFDI